MAEDKLPEQDSTTNPATKKKPTAKKIAEKKADSVASKKTAAKKPAAKKTAAKKTTRKKVSAQRASVATPVPAATTEEIPKAAPQPPAPPPVPEHSHRSSYDVDDDHDGMSGLLVTAGPLIILGFLILVMSNGRHQQENTSQLPVQIQEKVSETNSGLGDESLKELIILDAAKDLNEAFKEAGLKLPTQGMDSNTTGSAPILEVPEELQNNPWAPQQPGRAAVDSNAPPAPPPVPGYNQYNPAAVPQYPPQGHMGGQGAWGG